MEGAKAEVRFIGLIRAAVEDGTFVRLTLTETSAPDEGRLRVTGRLIELDGRLHLSWTRSRPGAASATRNESLDEALARLEADLSGPVRSALLATTARDWQLGPDRAGGWRLVSHKPATKAAPSRGHDEPAQRLLDPRLAPFLRGFGLTSADGSVLPRGQDKFRQIAHFIEILDQLVDDLGWAPGRAVRLVDMGCGRGHLTFAAWHLLRQLRRLEAEVTGVEQREALVAAASRLAREGSCAGLRFVAAPIADVPLEGVHAVVALHACNTATDDALLRGVRAGADLLLVVPCCHRELRPLVDAAAGREASGHALGPILRHGLFRERFAEWLTDGLRALYLEWAGYETRVVEFVAADHTPKNLLLAAIRRQRLIGPPGLRARIEAIKDQFGIARHALDDLFGRPPPVPAPAPLPRPCPG